jgi:hypothetical protein
MWVTVKTNALAFHRSFHQSGVIVFARLQVLVGAVWCVLTTTDLAPLIANQKYLTYWLIASGVITELSRRSRSEEDEDGHLVPRRDNTVNVTVNTVAPPAASPIGPVDGNTK